MYVVEQENHRVQRFSPTGGSCSRWGGEGSGNGQFLSPSAIDVGPDGTVYVADDERDDVQVFSPTGQYLERFGSHGSGNGQFEIPTGIAVSDAGAVYVADNLAGAGAAVRRLDPTADSDGDALPDSWEFLGYDRDDDGDVDVDLPAMGADPVPQGRLRRDRLDDQPSPRRCRDRSRSSRVRGTPRWSAIRTDGPASPCTSTMAATRS